MSNIDNTLSGEVLVNHEVETKNGKKFRQVVIETSDKPDKYPSPVAIDFWGDKTAVGEAIRVGDTVEIHVNIKGRQWNDKYFNSINGWRFDILSGAVNAEVKAEAEKAMDEIAAKVDEDGDSQLPF